jgi:hypothetical protein
MVWFSRVTMSRSVSAARTIAAVSSGLTVGTCSTAASMWSASLSVPSSSGVRPGQVLPQ